MPAPLLVGAMAVVAACLSAALILLLRPWLRTYALASPNARSSHQEPTPQGGGIAVVSAVLATAWCVAALYPGILDQQLQPFLALTAAAALLAIVGAIDDIRGLSEAPRLALQCLAVGTVVATLPTDFQIISFIPGWLERLGLFVVGVWFVNLVNFLDGIDWMTVAETVPITAAIGLLGFFGVVSWLTSVVALALLGAILGFAPFNKPVAKLFLGDVGSLPIGLLLGWLLLQLAGHGYLAAALLLPLYYLADATLTLFRRLAAGERIWQAHRGHFYQRATERGFSVREVIARVFFVNLVLAALALLTVAYRGPVVSTLALVTGSALVAGLLAHLARGKGRKGLQSP